MSRRKFLQKAGLGISALGATASGIGAVPEGLFQDGGHGKKRIKPAALKPGDRVMMIAPASSPGQKGIDEAVRAVEKLGYEVVEAPHLRSENGFLAGTDDERLSDFHGAWVDDSIQGIWCVRGGYGATRLLQRIDWSLIESNPKVFIGYSDITALHNSIFENTGLITFHGPVGTSEYTDYTKKHLRILSDGASSETVIRRAAGNTEIAVEDPVYRFHMIRKGRAIGMLAGGNLTLLASMCGTGFLPSFAGKIVFLEDIGESPYRIDRMFVQLMQATDIDQAAAIVHGIYKGCGQDDPEKQSLMEVIGQTLGRLDIPQVYGLSFGHIDDQFTLPVGAYARIDTESGWLQILENAVI